VPSASLGWAIKTKQVENPTPFIESVGLILSGRKDIVRLPQTLFVKGKLEVQV